DMAVHTCEDCGANFPKLSQLLKHRRVQNHWKHKCESCKKSFSRKQNFDRHMARHNDERNQHCPECLKVFRREDALNEHLRQEHGWTGGAERQHTDQEGGGAAKRRKLDEEDPKTFYNIEKVAERKIEKFKTMATYYKVFMKDLEVEGLSNILKTLKQMFRSILDTITEDIPETDLVRISIDNPELDFPITLEFMRRGELTVDKILSQIERVLQSYQQFVVDEAFRIDIVHVQNPSGKERTPYVDLAKSLQNKGSVIQIRNQDELCCARAIVTAIARHENDPQWNSIRRGYSMQRHLAEQLHQQAGVPLQRCGIDEVKKFQSVLPNYQIHVFYFCLRCKKGYDHKEKHACNDPCVYCHKLHSDEKEKWTFCSKCNRHFKSDLCYQMHLKTSDAGKSTCNTYFKCENCDQTINMDKHKKAHVCHEVYCKTCKDFVTEDHMCYMQPVIENTSSCERTKNKDKILSVRRTNDCNVNKDTLKDRMANAGTAKSLGAVLLITDQTFVSPRKYVENVCKTQYHHSQLATHVDNFSCSREHSYYSTTWVSTGRKTVCNGLPMDISKRENKEYKIVFDKRVIGKEYLTHPYGY
ncbi:ZN468-like protein, partial [Mya arenaria]